MRTTDKYFQEVIQTAISWLSENKDWSGYGCDLHNEVYNTDYFIIGTYQAKQWLANGPGVFEAIETIREYEDQNFGSVTCDFSDPEKVCNMFVYIAGELALQESKTLQEKWNDKLEPSDIALIIEELENV